ncbi:MAG: hypothetical protein HN742_22165 [Lentisphaerae bacterium]|jgi:polysaccharide biosynthesis protein PslG|nr:hypothetical protein [Lentisphaerota bacterium]MBT4816149.1 hypothetical protein [Lentisphaerota bacterium]MBT5605264.1 hypothetical protein [Lentisphaerota bacterium]MBT7059243.1 hypothetical protein [Lentisphaerota bacterium]MBT7844598.1 hypothetical protein [Lentisphaerota bacterium]
MRVLAVPALFLMTSLSFPPGAAAASRTISIDPMTGTANWQLGGHRVNYVLGASTLTASTEQVRADATASLKLAYDFNEKRRTYISAYWQGDAIPGRCRAVSFWLFGDGSQRPLSLAIEDAAERWCRREIGPIDWDGWKCVTVTIADGDGWRPLRRRGENPQPLEHPVRLRQIMVGKRAEAPPEGAVYLHDLSAEIEARPMDFVTARLSTGRPANLFYRGDEGVLEVALTNRSAETVSSGLTVVFEDFRGRRTPGDVVAVALEPGESTTIRVGLPTDRLGAFTALVALDRVGEPRFWRQRYAVSEAGTDAAFSDDSRFGCHASIRGFQGDRLNTAFQLNRDAGIRWERLSFNWRNLEPSPGRFVWDPPPTVPGVNGRAVRGPSGLASAPDYRLNLRDAVTLAFWIRGDATPGAWQWPVLKYAENPYRNYGVFLHKDTGVASFTASFERGGRSPYFGVSSGWSPWDGKWHHFAATYAADTGLVIIYVDGREIKREAVDGGRLQTGEDGVRLGSAFSGDLDEVVLWDRALAPEEIATLASKADPPAEGMTAWWRFDCREIVGLDFGPIGLHAASSRNLLVAELSRGAREHGMHILGILGFPPKWASTAPADAARPWVYKPDLEAFSRYVETTTRRFAGLVDHWEIWNEPNISVFWEPEPDAGEFFDVVQVGYAAAKKGNPGCTVITPGLAGAGSHGVPFLDELIEAGAAEHCDAISIHPYRQTTPEESDLAGDLLRICELTEKHGGRRPLWITEWCWTTQIGGGSSEYRSAIMTGRGIPLALGTGVVDRVIWFRLADPGTDRFYSEHNYGLCYHDMTPKPSYFAFRTCARLLDGAESQGDLKLGGGVWTRRFRRGEQTVLAVWHPNGYALTALDVGQSEATIVDIMGNSESVAARDGALFVQASEAVRFVVVEGDIPSGLLPVELRTPQKVRPGETHELTLLLRNPLKKNASMGVRLSGMLRHEVNAQVEAGCAHTVAFPLTLAPSAKPGRHPIRVTGSLGDVSWTQTSEIVVTTVPPGDALVGHWTFDEGEGEIVHDATTNANHGVVAGCDWVPGKKGTGLAFGGSSSEAVGGPAAQADVADLVLIPDVPSLGVLEDVTVAFWLKLTGDTGTWQFPVAKFRSNLARNYGVYIRPSDFAACFSTSFSDADSPHVDVGGGPNLNDGQWHHVAATCTMVPGAMRMYVDGTEVASRALQRGVMALVDEPLRIGAGTKGIIDDVRIYARALTAGEIPELAR